MEPTPLCGDFEMLVVHGAEADGSISSRRSVAWWLLEAESAWWGIGNDLIAHLVDHDVVVEPTECREVLGIRPAALRPGDLVVWLEPVAAGAAVCCASAIPVEDSSAEFGWDDPGSSSCCQGLTVVEADVFG